MEKFSEKRNFGIPVTILCFLAYLIGYLMTTSLSSSLLVAVLFAAAVFVFQFDERVKSAVKQAYVFAALAQVVYLIFELFKNVIDLFMPKGVNVNNLLNYYGSIDDLMDTYDVNDFQIALQNIYKYGLIIVDFIVLAVFILFLIQTLRNKEFKLGFISKLTGESANGAAAAYRQPQQPVNAGTPCPNCGKVNQPGAGFCASCGAKLK